MSAVAILDLLEAIDRAHAEGLDTWQMLVDLGAAVKVRKVA